MWSDCKSNAPVLPGNPPSGVGTRVTTSGSAFDAFVPASIGRFANGLFCISLISSCFWIVVDVTPFRILEVVANLCQLDTGTRHDGALGQRNVGDERNALSECQRLNQTVAYAWRILVHEKISHELIDCCSPQICKFRLPFCASPQSPSSFRQLPIPLVLGSAWHVPLRYRQLRRIHLKGVTMIDVDEIMKLHAMTVAEWHIPTH